MYRNINGLRNTALGYNADVSTGSLNNATAIGNSSLINASDKIRIGNAGTTCENATGSWTPSDGRFKYDVKEDVKGLEFINALRLVVYNFDAVKFETFLRQNFPSEQKENQLNEMKDALEKATAVRQTGFIAQDVEDAAKRVGNNFNGVHHPETKEDNYSVSYEKFVVPLVKAVQELSNKNEELGMMNARLLVGQEELQNKNDKQVVINFSLQQQIDELKSALLKLMIEKCLVPPINKTTTNKQKNPATCGVFCYKSLLKLVFYKI